MVGGIGTSTIRNMKSTLMKVGAAEEFCASRVSFSDQRGLKNHAPKPNELGAITSCSSRLKLIPQHVAKWKNAYSVNAFHRHSLVDEHNNYTSYLAEDEEVEDRHLSCLFWRCARAHTHTQQDAWRCSDDCSAGLETVCSLLGMGCCRCRSWSRVAGVFLEGDVPSAVNIPYHLSTGAVGQPICPHARKLNTLYCAKAQQQKQIDDLGSPAPTMLSTWSFGRPPNTGAA